MGAEGPGLSDRARRGLSVLAISLAAAMGVGLAWTLAPDRPRRGAPLPAPPSAPLPSAVAGPIEPIVPPDVPAPTSPSILLLTLDTTRADHLGTYGYFRDTSPTLDALAAESVVFERYLVPMSITLPSHMSVFTSTFPDEHGVVANMAHGGLRFVPSPQLESFAQLAAGQGYVTAGIVSSSPLKKYTGIATGFQQYYEPTGEARHARETTDLAVEWVKAAPDRPFFLWVHYFDPHWPYNPPPRWSDVFHGKDADVQAGWLAERRAVPEDIGLAKVEAKVDKYDAEIRYMDHQIGRLFAALRAKGGWDDLVVVVVGDHGEGLMQHSYPSHGHVWNEQVNAPFFLRIPEMAARRVAEPVSAVDVIPTLLGQIDLPEEARFLAQSSGRDALATAAVPVVFRTSEIQHDKATDTKFAKPITWGIADGRWTIHETGGEIDLFDRETDPHELVDVSGEHPEIAGRLAAELTRRRAEQVARGQQFGAGETEALGDAERAALEALGYVDGEPDEQAPRKQKAPRTR